MLSVSDLQGILSGTTQSPSLMSTPSASNSLNQYFNTAQYQLQGGGGAAAMTAGGGQYNPAQAFMSDPGIQLAIQQSQNQLGNQYAARGLGQSGALSAALGQNLFSNYNAYNTNQGNLFSNYQNQLSGLANLGATNSGAATANANAQNQANLAASTGQQQSANYQNTGSNISGLQANQGVLNASGYLNTGAAQANNLFQGANLLSQLNNNAQASANAQQTAYGAGAGQLAGQQGVGRGSIF